MDLLHVFVMSSTLAIPVVIAQEIGGSMTQITAVVGLMVGVALIPLVSSKFLGINDDRKEPDMKSVGNGLLADSTSVFSGGLLGGVAADTYSGNVPIVTSPVSIGRPPYCFRPWSGPAPSRTPATAPSPAARSPVRRIPRRYR